MRREHSREGREGGLLRRQALYPLSYGRILLLQYRRRWPAPTTPTPASLISLFKHLESPQRTFIVREVSGPLPWR